MQKRLMSTVLLFAIAAGFGIYSVTSLIGAHHTDDTIQALLYLVPSIAAIVALILLPFRGAPQDE